MPPFFRLQSPVVWTTLSLTLRVDGSATFEIVGASPFPRHWIYGADEVLSAKVGVADFRGWYHGEQGRHTPWGDEDTPALVTAIESALERELSSKIMRSGTKPAIRTLKRGGLLTQQGAEGHELFLLLDGVLSVEVDGDAVAEVGPGAIVGERATLEGGRRSSTLQALTRCPGGGGERLTSWPRKLFQSSRVDIAGKRRSRQAPISSLGREAGAARGAGIDTGPRKGVRGYGR